MVAAARSNAPWFLAADVLAEIKFLKLTAPIREGARWVGAEKEVDPAPPIALIDEKEGGPAPPSAIIDEKEVGPAPPIAELEDETIALNPVSLYA